MDLKFSTIRVGLDIPFEPSRSEVIFIKEKYDRDATDEIIIKNLKSIKKTFRKNHLVFSFLPNIKFRIA